MKIFNWNCNGAFREDFKKIMDEKSDTYVDADIFVIQECEDPKKEGEDYEEYRKFVEEQIKNYFWIGNPDQSKGLGIFAKDVNIEKIGEWAEDIQYFLAVRVEDSFNLLGVWAMDPYVEMIHDFIDANKDNDELFDGNLIMCGDFNSNRIWNNKHTKKDEWKKAKNHDNLNCKLNEKGLYSVYHGVTGEKLKNCEEENNEEELKPESKNTFFLYRHLNKPFHIDYFYANEDLINNTKWRLDKEDHSEYLSNEFEILERWQWISMSDHLPLVLNLREKIEFESEYVLHKVTQENLKLFDLEFVASERQFTEENNTSEIEDIECIGETSRVDNIAFNKKEKTLVLIEYKNVKDSNVIEQAKGYLELVEKYPKKFAERRYDECGNEEEEPKEYEFEKTRVMIIGPEFTKSQIDDSPKNFELWVVSLYDCGNNKGVVEYKNVKTRKIIELNIDLDNLDFTEKKSLMGKPQENCDLYHTFKDKVMENDSEYMDFRFLVDDVSFRTNDQIVCIFRLKNKPKIHYFIDKDVSIKKQIEDLNKKRDTNEIRDISKIKSGGKANYELTLNSNEDIDDAYKLFEIAFKQKRGD